MNITYNWFRFDVLENLVDKLTDYGSKEEKGEDAIDEMYGVAVVFDEDEENKDQLDEVQVSFSSSLIKDMMCYSLELMKVDHLFNNFCYFGYFYLNC